MKIYNDILPVASELVSRMIQEFKARECDWYNPHNETGYQLAIEDVMEIEIRQQYNKDPQDIDYADWKDSYAFGVTTPEQYMNMMEYIIVCDDAAAQAAVEKSLSCD